MDIELLSRMVGELILDNDKVVLPGLGAFVAEMEPASFSDRGYTINPPYRRLSFRGGDDADDGILASFYASNNSIPEDVAGKIIKDFSAGLKTALLQQRVLVLPGLGRLRTTREGKVFLIPDENLDIYPAGIGLDPISLKSHSKPQSFDFSQLDVPVPAAPAQESSAPESPELPESAEPSTDVPATDTHAAVEPESEPPTPEVQNPVASEPEAAARRRMPRGWKALLVTLLVMVILAALAAGAVYLASRFYPDFLDRILYSEEELELIHYYGK